ncbi:unnamed protein product [Parnassius apollo]|uniref:(apollo) hypothetical protein n=1 Tax=Parnassius apollo TaxID=110799 RepID=A0A8S3WWB4_PARAO|nr:unnamed protein product [Parnassius apollo]
MCDNRRRTYCCVFVCLNNSSIPELSLFRLPIEQDRRLQWLHLIDREYLKNKSQPYHVVCEAHFHPEDIMKNSVRKLLKKIVCRV